MYLKADYKIIEENIIFKDNIILFNKYIVKITISDYINEKKVNSTNFKYVEINFVKNYNNFYEEMIYVKSFDNVEIHYINIELVLRQIYNKTKLELNEFERFIILITSTTRDEMKDIINNKYLYNIYKTLLKINSRELQIEYENDIKEMVDLNYYKNEFINEIKYRLIKYLDNDTIEEVLQL